MDYTVKQSEVSSDPEIHPPAGVTLRAVLIGIILVLAISFISPWAILLVKGSQLTSNAIPLIAVLFLFLLTAIVAPLLKLLPLGRPLSGTELITVYVMMLIGSVVVTTGFTGSFLSLITGAFYYATPENNWGDLFVRYIHPWLAPSSEEAIRYFYEGAPAGEAIPWMAWARPLISWTAFILLFYFVTLCIAVLLRGQWVEHDRLVFPLTRLPLGMIEEAGGSGGKLGGLFKSRLFWLGFAVPVVLHAWNSLGNYTPLIHKVKLTTSIVLLNREMSIPLRLNLPVIGLAYLIHMDVAFGLWFFFAAYTIERWVFTRMGYTLGTSDIWTSGGAPTAIAHQQAGAMLVLAISLVWMARGHLKRLFRLAWKGEKQPDELISPRTAFVGLILGVAFMVGWLHLTGLSLPWAALLVAGAFAVFIALSRIIAEAGLPGCQTPMAPQAFLARGFGADVLGMRNMTALGLSTVWMGETATNMMNAMTHTLKLTTPPRKTYATLSWVLFLAILVGLAGSIWMTLHLSYRYGGINLHRWYFEGAPRWPFRYLASVASSPERSFVPRLTFTAIGGAIMAVLILLRQRFVWWPLHPVSFPIASTYTIVSYDWFAVFLAWLFKGIILRYGGIKAYRTFLPLFLGLILGEFFIASVWVFIDGAVGYEGNMIFNF